MAAGLAWAGLAGSVRADDESSAFGRAVAPDDPFVPLAIYDAGEAGGEGNFNTGWAGFPAHWELRQRVFAAEAGRQGQGIVFLGDSLTEMADLPALFPDLPTVNRGISGDTSRGMLFRLAHDVLSLEPLAVVVLCGANDVAQEGFDAEGTAANVRAIAEAAQAARAGIPVIVMATLPQDNPANAQRVVQVNRELGAALRGVDGVRLVNTYSPFLGEDGRQKPGLFSDGIHLTAEGYQVLAEALRPALDQVELPAAQASATPAD